jgi:hypothetical protein
MTRYYRLRPLVLLLCNSLLRAKAPIPVHDRKTSQCYGRRMHPGRQMSIAMVASKLKDLLLIFSLNEKTIVEMLRPKARSTAVNEDLYVLSRKS